MKNIKKKSLLKIIIPLSLLAIFLISNFCLVAIFTAEVSAKR